ncbi:ABC transporter ATP-binding protein [Staphylococcus sp. 18_1_E_LY]|uniref:ABC transporter ATP-binding protein n=1 Tax=Staphylococcus lloydii TaxID=2781774 RepID=A0A7T1B0C7_9STAP|nr:ABC transporter ATP-binding protein [Staphylococcus lloydii]MBF7020065.1 ABC transporter ATP-binding protein [Staphylococcus lloydii]MBF7027748.1 ABC transporter ATP-binding protein [Staphylococcus lloydii]QPM75425.1 ABC transporter ATP-binding protein [Staphylococcus lloydii]
MIELTNINKSFRNLHIFNNLNMTFNDKQLTVLLGENGAGKSTLLRLIATLENPNSGTIQYFGEHLNKQSVRHLIGYIPQDIALFEHMTVNENINCFKALSKNPISDSTIDNYAQQLNLTERESIVANLSGGTKRKVNVLIGLLSNPKVLILDEPTVGIDLKSRYDIHHLLNNMKSQRLIILTTHHLDEVEALADNIKVIGSDPFYREVLKEKNWSFEVYDNTQEAH